MSFDEHVLVLVLTEQGIKELTLEDVDDSVQRLLELVVFLHLPLFGLVLAVTPLF